MSEFNAVNNYRLMEQPFPLEIVEVEELEKFEILPGVEAVASKTPHTDESHAIHIRDTDGKTLVYSADTGFSKNHRRHSPTASTCSSSNAHLSATNRYKNTSN